MPDFEPMQDMTPGRYSDDRWIGVHGVTDVVWPCPRCAMTLTAHAGRSMAIHACSQPKVETPAKNRAAAARVAAWWAGYDAAQATAEPCRQGHVPEGGHVLIFDPADGPAVYLTNGGRDAQVYLLTDRMVSGDDVFGTAHPVERAVLAARLAAMADLLAPALAPAHDRSDK